MSLVIGAVQEKRVFPDHLAFLDLAVSLGFTWVEFKYEARIDPDGMLRKEAGTHLGKLAQSQNLAISVHAAFDNGINLGSTDKNLLRETRQRIRESLEFAERVNAKYVTIHGGFFELGYTLEPDDQNTVPPFQLVREEMGSKAFESLKERIINELGTIREYARKRGIVVAPENLHGFSYDRTRFPVTPDDFHACRRALGDDLLLVYDAGHAHSTGLSASEFVSAIGPSNIVGSHIHDNDGSDDQHLPVGKGSISLQEFFMNYSQKGWSFPLNVEVRSKEHFIQSKQSISDSFANND